MPAGRRRRHTVVRLLAVPLLGLLVSHCAAPPKESPVREQTATEQELQAATDESIRQSQGEPVKVPEDVAAALLPPVAGDDGTGESAAVEQRFDVKVRQAPAREFFLSLVEGTPYNVVVHPEVAGTIDLDMKNVSVPEVMETVGDIYGYEYKETRTGYQVYPNTIRSRLFEVDYLRMERSGRSNTQANPGQVTTVEGNGSNRGGGGGGRSSSQVSGSNIETKTESAFWTELETSVKAIVGEAEGRAVSVNPQAGLVMVRALPNELRDVGRFLDQLQEVVQRQVIIEARVLEVQLSEAFRAGINWAAIGRDDDQSILASQMGGAALSGSGTHPLAGQSGVLNPQDLPTVREQLTSAFGGSFAVALDVDNFSAFIELLKQQGDVQVLSKPRISTVNNQKAVIKVGSDEFFVTDISSNTTTTGATTTTGPDVELTPFFSGVTLDVTPQISADDEVILHVHPSVSEVTEEQKEITVGTTISAPLATSTIRESDSIIRAQNGQIVVIGGLMRDNVTNENASLPLLGDLPVIGNAFRHRQERHSKSELVILLKPVVVRGRAWSNALRQSSSVVRDMDQEGR